MNTFFIFNDDPISNVTQQPDQRAKRVVNEASSDEILNTDSEEFAEYVVNQYQLDPINLDLEDPQLTIDDWASDEEPALRFRYSGNERILRLQPSPHRNKQYRTEVDDEENCVDIYFPRRNDDYSDKELQNFRKEINEFVKTHHRRVHNNIDDYYNEIKDCAERFHKERKEQIIDQQQRYDELEFDVVRREDIEQTLKIDEPERRKEITLDNIKNENPSSGISDEVYYEIIQAVDAVGNGFERSPETYSNFGEEDYRNVILTFLEMNFVGSATGETFNNEGRSDILLRHDGDNVFIAECGMWLGPHSLSGPDENGGKISQLLERYLTWRDSKTAVILFVDRGSFSKILEKVPAAVESHPLYAGEKEQKSKNWWQYSFNRPDDEKNPVDLAVLAFDVSTSG